MPGINWKLKVIRKEYAKGLERGLVGAIYNAYSQLNRRAYILILQDAPRSKSPSARWPTGFVSSHIKLVTKRKPPYVYEEVDVPGKHTKGSRAWRAWLAIKTLHEGWKVLPFERKPTRKKVLKFPIKGTAIFRRKTIQRRQVTFNPWITRVWKALEPEFPKILEDEIEKENRRKITKKGIR